LDHPILVFFLAPGAYKPEQSSIGAQKPAFSFGIKTKQEKVCISPAPGSYNVDKKLDSTPSYSFGIRHNVEKTWTTPGKDESLFIYF
jgi:hypothetical protein